MCGESQGIKCGMRNRNIKEKQENIKETKKKFECWKYCYWTEKFIYIERQNWTKKIKNKRIEV